MSRSSLPPDAWKPAHSAAKRLTAPIYRFFALETASGLLLFAAVAIALGWANSPWAEYYHAIWHTDVVLAIGGWSTEKDLHFWVNDGLMTIFFFVVGLEIRREIHEGELSSPRKAALPVAAAIGGVLVPMGIFMALNHGRASAGGWAIPMATDIAFALGVMTLLGRRVPAQWRILLLGLAVIDDIIAIVVIAVFFSAGVALEGLAVAAGGVAVVVLLRAAGVRSLGVYVIPGIFVWFGFYESGIHPTLAGVLLGMLAPVRPWFGPTGFKEATQANLQDLETADRSELLARLDEIERLRREAISPCERLIHALHPWVSFLVMPGFALANSGVALGGADLSGDGLWLFAGIVAGLVLGKPLGITAASVLSSKMGITARSAELTTRGIVLVGTVGGIGFTMSLFIAQLAFAGNPGLLDASKLAVMAGSAVAMILGLAYGLAALKRLPHVAPDGAVTGDVDAAAP